MKYPGHTIVFPAFKLLKLKMFLYSHILDFPVRVKLRLGASSMFTETFLRIRFTESGKKAHFFHLAV